MTHKFILNYTFISNIYYMNWNLLLNDIWTLFPQIKINPLVDWLIWEAWESTSFIQWFYFPFSLLPSHWNVRCPESTLWFFDKCFIKSERCWFALVVVTQWALICSWSRPERKRHLSGNYVGANDPHSSQLTVLSHSSL